MLLAPKSAYGDTLSQALAPSRRAVLEERRKTAPSVDLVALALGPHGGRDAFPLASYSRQHRLCTLLTYAPAQTRGLQPGSRYELVCLGRALAVCRLQPRWHTKRPWPSRCVARDLSIATVLPLRTLLHASTPALAAGLVDTLVNAVHLSAPPLRLQSYFLASACR